MKPSRLGSAGRYVIGAIALALFAPLHAAEVKVAVAANFTAAMQEIVPQFEQASGHQVVVAYGSTGRLYAQIKHGAPFGLFLAADSRRPELLEEEGVAVAGSRFTYARGKLVLWSPRAGLVDDAGQVLNSDQLTRISMANPKTAPYGMGAQQVLENMGLWEDLRRKIVQGDSISQAFQFVASGNVPLGFIAKAQIALLPEHKAGSQWEIPPDRYDPLDQQAVLLEKGADNPAAQALHQYLQSQPAREVIERYGYGV